MSLVDFSVTAPYQTPGVYAEVLPFAVNTTVGIAPTVVGFVGDTQRYTTFSEIDQLLNTQPVALTQMGINLSTVVITDRFSGVIYNLNTDYVLTNVASASGAAYDLTTISLVSSGNIPPGNYIVATYQYTGPAYFAVQTFTSQNLVQTAYGTPFTSTGAINSPVTLASFLAFQNDATQVVISPLSPASSGAPTENDWQNAINALTANYNVNVIVPLTSDPVVHAMVYAAGIALVNSQQYIRGFVGLPSGSAFTAYSSEAIGFSNARMTVCGPGDAMFYLGTATGQTVDLPGPYVAAAMAGLHSSLAAQEPITNKTLQGFTTLPNQPTQQQMIQMQSDGVCWAFQNRNGAITIRHGLTTDMSNIYNREISVQAAQDRLLVLLIETLEAQNLIGSVFTSNTPLAVVASVVGSLEEAIQNGLIYEFSDIEYRQPTTNPTLLQVQFMYQPSLPLNYIQVQFGIDTSVGSTTFTVVTTSDLTALGLGGSTSGYGAPLPATT